MDIWDYYRDLHLNKRVDLIWAAIERDWLGNDQYINLGDQQLPPLSPGLGPHVFIPPVSAAQGESENVLRGGECSS